MYKIKHNQTTVTIATHALRVHYDCDMLVHTYKDTRIYLHLHYTTGWGGGV